ncbi:MAG: FeoB-associated Cys-rich membrane protein [Acutalibacteraceae bacterium]
MKPLDYVLLALIALALFFALRHVLRRKKSGGCIGCSCGCGSCESCKKQ